MMVAPPLEAGAVQDTTEEALACEVAVTEVGAPGTVFLVVLLYEARLALEESAPFWGEAPLTACVASVATEVDWAVAARPKPPTASTAAHSVPMAADATERRANWELRLEAII